MNLSFFAGLILCVLVCIIGIVSGNTFDQIRSFLDMPSMLITVGGTMFALLASFPFKDMAKIVQHFPILLGLRKNDPIDTIHIMTGLSEEARKKGLLSLEDSVSQFEDAFLHDSVMLIVDGLEPDKVRDRLDNEMNNIEARHAASWDIYDKGAALAPGFGMIGTLIGLVNMLKAMTFEEEGGASALARNMAVALITTFYGVFMANVIFIPIGSQLRIAHNEEMVCKEIIIEGIISIQSGENPRHVKEKLMSVLTHKQREKAVSQSHAAA